MPSRSRGPRSRRPGRKGLDQHSQTVGWRSPPDQRTLSHNVRTTSDQKPSLTNSPARAGGLAIGRHLRCYSARATQPDRGLATNQQNNDKASAGRGRGHPPPDQRTLSNHIRTTYNHSPTLTKSPALPGGLAIGRHLRCYSAPIHSPFTSPNPRFIFLRVRYA